MSATREDSPVAHTTCAFGPDRLSRLAAMERDHFWFRGRQLLVERLVERYWSGNERPVADIGCGTGTMLQRLKLPGRVAIGLDLRPEGIEALKQSTPDERLAQANVETLPLASGRFGGALLLDVLEHVDDRATLIEAARILGSGGVVIATIPAMPWLWSYRDVGAGHRRRYTQAMVRELVAAAGLQLLTMTYYQFLLFPIVVASRLAGRRWPATREIEDDGLPWLNGPLSLLNRFEAGLTARGVRWPFGSSIVFVAEKR